MLIGYARISKHDGTQVLDSQIDIITDAGVIRENIYTDKDSGVSEERNGLLNCLRALRGGDVLVVNRLDRLGRSTRQLLTIVAQINEVGANLRILTGELAGVNTETAVGKMLFTMLAAVAEFERELIRERTLEGLRSARARGRSGGRPPALTRNKILLAQAAMRDRDTVVSELCEELGVSQSTLYRYVSPDGTLRAQGEAILSKRIKKS